jgi:hypothetical protein
LNLSSPRVARPREGRAEPRLWLWKKESHFGPGVGRIGRRDLALSRDPLVVAPRDAGPKGRLRHGALFERTIQFSRTEGTLGAPHFKASRKGQRH